MAAAVVVTAVVVVAAAAVTNPNRISGGRPGLPTALFSLCSSSLHWSAGWQPLTTTGDVRRMKEEPIEIEGRVHTVLPGTMFRVELANKHLVLATICGKMRKRWVRLTVGDRVKMEMSPYDLNKARIVWRLK